MKTRLATTCFVVGALIAPVAGYAADPGDKDRTVDRSSPKDFVKDSVITTEIKAKFAKDKKVSAMNIKVDTDAKGQVRLSGEAKSRAEADKAVALAKATKGVVSVQNDIQIGKTADSMSNEKSTKVAEAKESPKEALKDSVITVEIKAKMAKDKQVAAHNIKVDTDANGVVHLSGTAKSKVEADKAVSIAKATKGVTSVDSDIQVVSK